MKRLNQPVGWGLFLLLAGIFLLLWNLGVMDPWGDLAWGVIYALAGLGFLIWFATEVGRWWRAIPAFTLLSIGAMIILGWRGVNLGEWRAPIVLFGMALGFWAIVIVRKEHWWALVPAGVLTTVGVLFGLWSRLTDAGRPAVLYIRDVPVMWLPFLFQDTKAGRRSGILIPQFGLNDIVRPSRSYNRQE